jgi:S1-C subfamily serine protease
MPMLAQPLISLVVLIVLYPVPPEPEPDDKGKGFFGVQMVENSGVIVARVEPGSPAEKAGFRVNDIIHKIDSNSVPTINDAREIIGRLRPGSIARVEVRRGEATVKLKVKVGVRPETLP